MVTERARYSFQRSDLVGGHAVLDLVNTVTGRDSRPTDWLETYERLLEWAALTDAFLPDDLRALERMRAGDASAAARALARLRAMREAVYDVVIAAIRHKPVPEDAMGRLTRHWKSSVAAAQLTFSAGRASLQFNIADSRLEYPRHVLAASAFDLLQTLPLARTRECADPRCTWIFIDHSRGGQRRWCNMATCGNQAKSRRHHQRKRAAP